MNITASIKTNENNWIDYCLHGVIFILIIGTPLIFTSYTRSVFEVNKLLLLRVCLLMIYGLWLLKTLLYPKEYGTNQKIISIGMFSWKKTGLEWPILIWASSSIISTILSQSIIISIIGSYDRWEGIITVSNYILLFWAITNLIEKKWHLYSIMAGLLGSTFISSVYGVFQSLGYDFMNWSVDPTARVFACINNPVHFCAYVSMLVPTSMSVLIYLSEKKKGNSKITPLQWVIFFVTTIIYYAQFLSYSRATWVGFCISMPLLYLHFTHNFNQSTLKTYIIDILFSTIAMGSLILVYLFTLHLKNSTYFIIITTPLLLYVFYSFNNKFNEYKQEATPQDKLIYVLAIGILIINYLTQLPFTPLLKVVSQSILTLGFFTICYQANPTLKRILTRIIILIIFVKLQHISLTTTTIFQYGSLVIAFYLTEIRNNTKYEKEKKIWLIIFLTIFGVVIALPSIPGHLNRYFNLNSKELAVAQHSKGTVGYMKSSALEGTARTSMWKSAIPWTKDYPLFGSGLDTIKFMYPVYRRPEYGKLEGGHNYTPDRLHNEYLNTFASKGIIGFICYYIIFLGSCITIILKALQRLKTHPNRHLIAGCLAGGVIYLGQVLFNFGVVATLVFFYLLMGLSVALSLNTETQDDT